MEARRIHECLPSDNAGYVPVGAFRRYGRPRCNFNVRLSLGGEGSGGNRSARIFVGLRTQPHGISPPPPFRCQGSRMTVEFCWSQSPTSLARRLRSRPPEPVTENSLLKLS